MPTASAVLGDLLDAAHNLTAGGAGRTVALHQVQLRPIDDLSSPYYLDLQVDDRPGVLHTVAGVLGRHSVSVRSMEQEGVAGDGARLVFITHPALESDVQACLHELRALDVVSRIGGMIRVIGVV
jgi:homoserine dehydrogenase